MLFNIKKCKILILAVGLLSLTACSTVGKGKNINGAGAEVSDANMGATSSGIGGGDGDFVGPGAAGANPNAMRVGEQTYYFDFDKSFVKDSDRPSIDVQARFLAAHPRAKVLLEGNTDPRGSREYNIALGERRGISVAEILKLQGVGKNQIRVVSYGAEKSAAAGTTEEDYQLDRRVHLVYEDKG